MYIHQTSCISTQKTFGEIDLKTLRLSDNSQLKALEPEYPDIPLRVLRRMGKAVRIAVGSAAPLVASNPDLAGITLGTANGGFENCIQFLRQVVEYEEGMLTPTNFVQSTPNTITANIGMNSKNKGHNSTHVQRGLSFEMALIDAMMLTSENPGSKYLLGGVDEISPSNYHVEAKGGWHKPHDITNDRLYTNQHQGTISGEGSAMFVVNNEREDALAKVGLIKTMQTESEVEVNTQLDRILANIEQPDLLLCGANGDPRFDGLFGSIERTLKESPIARFKHMFGEFPTASALAVWLATQVLNGFTLPDHAIVNKQPIENPSAVLIYNAFKGAQHSFILLEKA